MNEKMPQTVTVDSIAEILAAIMIPILADGADDDE